MWEDSDRETWLPTAKTTDATAAPQFCLGLFHLVSLSHLANISQAAGRAGASSEHPLLLINRNVRNVTSCRTRH